MISSELILALQPVATTFDSLGVPYYIGGSIGSSFYGYSRATIDMDIVADIREAHIRPFYEQLREAYYLDEAGMRQAIHGQSCFNLIHLQTMQKIDVFVLKDSSYDRQAFARRRRETLGTSGGDTSCFLAAPEDVILHKLYWFRLGGEVSERQWSDVLGVLRVQADALDDGYLKKWAVELGVDDLLEKIRHQAFDSPSLGP